MDDIDLSFENYEELFGISQTQSEQLFENGGIDSLFGIRDPAGADVISTPAAYGAEVLLTIHILTAYHLSSPYMILAGYLYYCCKFGWQQIA